jgi:hypothetical protein
VVVDWNNVKNTMKSGFWNDNPSLDVLTDRQIDRYILEGRYGTERKEALEALQRRKRRRKFTIATDARALLKKLLG